MYAKNGPPLTYNFKPDHHTVVLCGTLHKMDPVSQVLECLSMSRFRIDLIWIRAFPLKFRNAIIHGILTGKNRMLLSVTLISYKSFNRSELTVNINSPKWIVGFLQKFVFISRYVVFATDEWIQKYFPRDILKFPNWESGKAFESGKAILGHGHLICWYSS